MRHKKKIIRLRTRQPLLTGSEISRKLEISRQYVTKVLKNAGLNNKQPHYKKKIMLCKVCGARTPRNQKVCPTGDCKEKYFHVDVECSFCHYKFNLQRSHVIQRYTRGMKHIYCSQKCYGLGQRDGIS
jgi:predicted amidophosphoribosyltransferase